ncbi:hypothetical protein V9L05_20000 [Bernardetia sp. Wsw4-3y2]|uniref:hypothetical protein n=1 Tax=Bernardetia sp. Wsw4-3y2 TaxID=3127471 RepID=UPI0030D4FA6C
MKQLTSYIQIGNFEFDFINEVQIESSWDSLTDTCTITIPKKLQWKGKDVVQGANAIFQIGSVVRVFLGYDYAFELVFEGFLTRIEPKRPLKLYCEDAMWNLKQTEVKGLSQRNATVKSLLSDYYKGELKTFEADLGKFRIQNATLANVFEELDKNYSLKTFFRNGVLHVGTPYLLTADDRKKHSFDFEKNIIDSDLEYKRKDEVKIKVKAISISSKDNSKIEVTKGDTEGELRTINKVDLSKAQLEEEAIRQIDLLKYEGFRGSFESFGEPFVRFCDIVELTDPNIQERNGEYFVKSVSYSFGMNGYRQNVELDKKVS